MTLIPLIIIKTGVGNGNLSSIYFILFDTILLFNTNSAGKVYFYRLETWFNLFLEFRNEFFLFTILTKVSIFSTFNYVQNAKLFSTHLTNGETKMRFPWIDQCLQQIIIYYWIHWDVQKGYSFIVLNIRQRKHTHTQAIAFVHAIATFNSKVEFC